MHLFKYTLNIEEYSLYIYQNAPLQLFFYLTVEFMDGWNLQ